MLRRGAQPIPLFLHGQSLVRGCVLTLSAPLGILGDSSELRCTRSLLSCEGGGTACEAPWRNSRVQEHDDASQSISQVVGGGGSSSSPGASLVLPDPPPDGHLQLTPHQLGPLLLVRYQLHPLPVPPPWVLLLLVTAWGTYSAQVQVS